MVESAAYLADAEQLMEGKTSLELRNPMTYDAAYRINYPSGEEAEHAGDLDWRRDGVSSFRRSFFASSDGAAIMVAKVNIETVARRYDVSPNMVELSSVRRIEEGRFIPLDLSQ